MNKVSADEETRWEITGVAIPVLLGALIAFILIALWLGGVWTGLIIVGVPLIAITAVVIWGTRSARATDREETQVRSPGTTRRSGGSAAGR